MLPVFITSNQIPLHVHAVFCQLHVQCIHLARGMMRMRIPSIIILSVVMTVQAAKFLGWVLLTSNLVRLKIMIALSGKILI